MRRDDHEPAAGREQAVKLFHGADDVRQVLDDVNGADLSKRVFAEREREMVEIGENVGPGVRVAIDTDGSRIFVDPAADVEDGKLF